MLKVRVWIYTDHATRNLIRRSMAGQRLTYREWAAKADTAGSVLSRWVLGRKAMERDRAQRALAALGLNMAAMLEGSLS